MLIQLSQLKYHYEYLIIIRYVILITEFSKLMLKGYLAHLIEVL